MPSDHLILFSPLLLPPSIFPSIRSFQMSHFFASGGQSIGVSASALVLLMNIQDWSPSGWTGWISLQSKGLSRVFSYTTVQKHIYILETYYYVKVKVTQLCPTHRDPMDYIVHGILQARILECVAFPFSRGSSQPRGQTQVSHIAGVDSLPAEPPGKPIIMRKVSIGWGWLKCKGNRRSMGD